MSEFIPESTSGIKAKNFPAQRPSVCRSQAVGEAITWCALLMWTPTYGHTQHTCIPASSH